MQRKYKFYIPHIALLLVLTLQFSGAHAHAADSNAAAGMTAALEMLPDETLGAIVIPQLSLADAKISGLGAPLQMPIPSPLMLGQGMLGLKEGLKQDGCALVAMVGPTSGDKDMGHPIIIVPTSDYQKLIAPYSPQDQGDGINKVTVPHTPGLLAAQKNGFAVFVHSSDDERKILEAVLQRPAGISKSIDPLKSWIAQQDVAVFLTPDGIKLFLSHVGQKLKAVAQSQPTANEQQAFAMLQQMIPTIQAEVSQIGLGLHIDDDHTLHLASRVQLLHTGELAKAVANMPAPLNPPLVGLPSGSFLLAADGSMDKTLSEWVGKLCMQAMKATAANQPDVKISEDDWNQFATALKQMQAAKSMSYVMGVPSLGKSLYSRMFSVMHVENAQAYLQNYEASMSTYGKILEAMHNPAMPSYEISKSELDGMPVLELTMDMSAVLKNMAQNGAPAAAGGFGQMLFGTDAKLTARLTAADTTTVVLAWGDTESLKTALDAVKSPENSLASDPDVKTTVALMPKNAQWRAFISPAGYLEFVKNMMAQMMPQMPLQIPPFPNTPDVGVSAQLGSQHVDFELLVPAGILEGVGSYMQQFHQHGP